jgi:hypothetical protein
MGLAVIAGVLLDLLNGVLLESLKGLRDLPGSLTVDAVARVGRREQLTNEDQQVPQAHGRLPALPEEVNTRLAAVLVDVRVPNASGEVELHSEATKSTTLRRVL